MTFLNIIPKSNIFLFLKGITVFIVMYIFMSTPLKTLILHFGMYLSKKFLWTYTGAYVFYGTIFLQFALFRIVTHKHKDLPITDVFY